MSLALTEICAVQLRQTVFEELLPVGDVYTVLLQALAPLPHIRYLCPCHSAQQLEI